MYLIVEREVGICMEDIFINMYKLVNEILFVENDIIIVKIVVI